jgi:hypothetical protein
MRKGGGAAGEATGEEEKEERERFPEKKRGAQKSPGVLGPGWETESKPDGDIELHRIGLCPDRFLYGEKGGSETPPCDTLRRQRGDRPSIA